MTDRKSYMGFGEFNGMSSPEPRATTLTHGIRPRVVTVDTTKHFIIPIDTLFV